MTAWNDLPAASGTLAEGRKAPIELPRETAVVYRRVLVTLLENAGVPLGVVEAGLSTASALLEGAQELIARSNELVRPDASAKQMMESSRQILLEIGALLRQRNGAYSVHQVAELVSSRIDAESSPAAFPRVSRLKDLLTPLEASFERVGIARALEPERLGPLLVHLDELYDDSAQQVERFYWVATRELPEALQLTPELLRRLYSDFAHASFEDHLTPSEKKGETPNPGSGLLSLLPELVQAFELI